MRARGTKMPEAEKNPPLRHWTQEASLLVKLIIEQRQTNALLIKINSKPDSPTPKVQPEPMPETAFQRAMEKARTQVRLHKHDDLVRKLLGDRAKKK